LLRAKKKSSDSTLLLPIAHAAVGDGVGNKYASLQRYIEDQAKTDDVIGAASPVKTHHASYSSRRSWLTRDADMLNIRATWLVASPVARVSATCLVCTGSDSSQAPNRYASWRLQLACNDGPGRPALPIRLSVRRSGQGAPAILLSSDGIRRTSRRARYAGPLGTGRPHDGRSWWRNLPSRSTTCISRGASAGSIACEKCVRTAR
jgi:hypothetical protein